MSLPPSYRLLAKYPNRIFVETGSYTGDAIQQALDAGFSEVRSIDIDPANTKFCRHRFDLIPRPEQDPKPVRLWTGDSAVMLWEMIRDIDESITFWLDGHSQWFENEPHNDHPFPLLEELKQIARHPVKCHHILIDDMLILSHPDVTGWTRGNIEDEVRAINPSYKFEYIANPVRNNLLICTI